MKRYNQVREGSYEPRSEMVEETDGDYVLWEDVEALQSKCAELQSKCAELLEALKLMLSIQCYVNYAMHRPKYEKAIEQAKTAIAKAEGGNS